MLRLGLQRMVAILRLLQIALIEGSVGIPLKYFFGQ